MRCARSVDGKGKRMSNARQGSVSHKFFEMVEAHKDDLAELHLRREIERMLNDYFKLFELHCVEGEYFIYDAFDKDLKLTSIQVIRQRFQDGFVSRELLPKYATEYKKDDR